MAHIQLRILGAKARCLLLHRMLFWQSIANQNECYEYIELAEFFSFIEAPSFGHQNQAKYSIRFLISESLIYFSIALFTQFLLGT